MTQIKNEEEFYEMVKILAKYTIADLIKENPSEYKSFAESVEKIIIPKMEDISRKQWSSELTFIERLDASREIIRLERDLKWIRDLYENVSNQRYRICYFDALPARSKYKIATRYKNKILNNEKVKGVTFANSGNTLYNTDYKQSEGSKDNMLIFSGLDKDDAYFYEIARFMLQIRVESLLLSVKKDYYKDLAVEPGEFDISKSLISQTINANMKVSFNSETDIILALEDILFNDGYRRIEKLNVRDKLDDIQYKVFLNVDIYEDTKDPHVSLSDDFLYKEFHRHSYIEVLDQFDKLLKKIKEKAPNIVRDHEDYLNSIMYDLP